MRHRAARAALLWDGAGPDVIETREDTRGAALRARFTPAEVASAPRDLYEIGANWMDRAIVGQTYEGRPMSTHHVLDAERPFDRAHLLGAVEALVRSVPTLRSVVRESPLTIRRFAAAARWSRLESLVTWSDAAIDLSGSEWLRREFDLARDEPFRVLHSPRPGGGWQLVFTLHHGVADGVGALALFDLLLAHYSLLCGDRGEAPEPVLPSGARLRRFFGRSGARLTATLLLDNARRIHRFTDRRASLLERETARAGPLCFAVLDVPKPQWARLRERAAALGCSRNDLMLAALLRAAVAWRRRRGMDEQSFRALIPVDLRRELGVDRASLQNHLGVIEADFAIAEIDSAALPRIVLARLREERAAARVLATPMALAILTLLPPHALRGFFRWLDERPGSFMYSFLFSHIRVPDALRVPRSIGMKRIYCLSALPRQPGVGLTVTATASSVTATLAYAPPRLSHGGAAELLALFEAELDRA